MQERATQTAVQPVPRRGDPPELAPRQGAVLGRYRLLLRLARGGMADVWIARQHGELGFSRLLAIKTMRSEFCDDASFRKMFLEEARLASRIAHTNVVEVVDLGEQGSVVFQAMDLVEGSSLSHLISRHRKRDAERRGLPVHIALRIFIDVTAGLHAAHELTDEDGVCLRVVHRDVSPQNILVGLDGIAKLTDFGIAKALGRVSEETQTGQIKGKYGYLAPEQVARRPPDRRTDIFATGIVLWEALTGHRLFKGIDVVDTLACIAAMPIPDPRTIVDDLPAPIAEVVMRALDRDPGGRFPTAAAMGDALEAAAREADIDLSTKAVASFVSDLVQEEIEAVRAEVRSIEQESSYAAIRQRPSPSEAPTVAKSYAVDEPSPGVVVPRRGEPRSRRSIAFAVLGLVAAAVGGAALQRALVRAPIAHAPAHVEGEGTSAPAIPVPATPPLAAVTDSVASPMPPSTASATASATAAATGSSSSKPPPRTTRPRTHPPKAQPSAKVPLQPKYDTPY